MADITLDPDDPEPSGAASAAATGAWAWAALVPDFAVKDNDDNASRDAPATAQVCVCLVLYKTLLIFALLRLWSHFPPNSQKSRSQFVTAASVVPTATMASQCPIVPAPPALGVGVARTSASVFPSPFAPPPALAPIAGPVSQSLPLPSSCSTAKAKSPDVVRAYPDQSALSNDWDTNKHPAGSEYVIEHTSTSTSRPSDGEPRAPSRQVCLSSRAILLSACVYAYVSCDRVRYYCRWTLPMAPRHHAPLHDSRRRPLCSYLPRLRVSDPLTFHQTLFLQTNPTHQMSYPSIHLRHYHHRHRLYVELVAVTHRPSISPTSKEGS